MGKNECAIFTSSSSSASVIVVVVVRARGPKSETTAIVAADRRGERASLT